MTLDIISLLGFTAGAVTSLGFIPQLIKGFKTKKLDDVSYWMPLVLIGGMTLWLLYGVFRSDVAIIIANAVGVCSNLLLLVMKRYYSCNELNQA